MMGEGPAGAPRPGPARLTFLVEALAAELADEGLVAGVDADVGVERGAPVERLPALVALVGFLLHRGGERARQGGLRGRGGGVGGAAASRTPAVPPTTTPHLPGCG